MNPLTNVKNITKLNELELARGTTSKSSWHDMYKDSAWIFIGGLAYGMTEGDVLAVFSQYGEIANINMVRDKKTGKIRGFCFVCYANQKSSVLAVDNFNGIKLCGRTIRVDHVSQYRLPKEYEDDDEITKMLASQGCLPQPVKTEPVETTVNMPVETKVKVKKEKKKKKKKRKKDSSDSDFSDSDHKPSIKKQLCTKKDKHASTYSKHDLKEKRYDRSVEKSSYHESESSISSKRDNEDDNFVRHKEYLEKKSSQSEWNSFRSTKQKSDDYLSHSRKDKNGRGSDDELYGHSSKKADSSSSNVKHKKSKKILSWLKK